MTMEVGKLKQTNNNGYHDTGCNRGNSLPNPLAYLAIPWPTNYAATNLAARKVK